MGGGGVRGIACDTEERSRENCRAVRSEEHPTVISNTTAPRNHQIAATATPHHTTAARAAPPTTDPYVRSVVRAPARRLGSRRARGARRDARAPEPDRAERHGVRAPLAGRTALCMAVTASEFERFASSVWVRL